MIIDKKLILLFICILIFAFQLGFAIPENKNQTVVFGLDHKAYVVDTKELKEVTGIMSSTIVTNDEDQIQLWKIAIEK